MDFFKYKELAVSHLLLFMFDMCLLKLTRDKPVYYKDIKTIEGGKR